MRFAVPLLALALLTLPVEAHAQLTALDLMRQCEGRGSTDPAEAAVLQLVCTAYVMGAHDMMRAVLDIHAPGQYCAPAEGLEVEQVEAIVLRWIRRNPEGMHLPARSAILIALMQAFPCQRVAPPSSGPPSR